MTSTEAAVDVASLLHPGTSRDIVHQLEGLIASGQLPPGTALPTIRELAADTGLSRGLLANAWALLRDRGLIVTRRRGGSFVATTDSTAPAAQPSPATSTVTAFDGWHALDLVTGHPDPKLQPDLASALAAALHEPHTNDPTKVYITDRLRHVAAAEWPFAPEAWSTVGGAGEATVLVAEAVADLIGRDRPIAVAQPTTPGTVASLRGLGLHLLPIEHDENGPAVHSLEQALRAGAAAVLLQPSSSFSLGAGGDQQRLDELAETIRHAPGGDGVIVIEDDVLGPLSSVQGLTVARTLPGQVVRMRSYCRAYGVDLRTTVIGGPARIVERVRALRSHGAAMNSRILQNALAVQLESRAATRVVERMERATAARRALLAEQLDAQGTPWSAPVDPLLLWVPTAHENQALLALAAHGVVLSPSEHTFVTPPAQGHLRIAVTQLPDSPELSAQFARLIGRAARGELAPPGF